MTTPKESGENPNLLGLTVTREENFSEWYTQVITKSEMIDYYSVSGCYILRPFSYAMWELIQKNLDSSLKKSGVENAYFPLLVTKSALECEKDHIEGFAPEVAWVTRAGNSELAEPLAIRPTSETIMYPSFAKWIRSHRDLPLRLNQWANVIRWEFKNPTPFIRSREFLWQEGHSAFATLEEASAEVREILELYRSVLEDQLAIPVILGRKSEGEKFAGGLYTTTCEAFIPATGRGIQAATSHCLGQNFSKMFEITYSGAGENGTEYVWQNSWGITTRTIGIMTMVHGDDKGLVLPPRVAPTQVIVIPIHPPKGKDPKQIIDGSKQIAERLCHIGVRASADTRDHYTAPYKYNHWELKGVPIRIEYGPRDADKKQVTLVIRFNGVKQTLPLDQLETAIPIILEKIQAQMFERAKHQCEGRISKVASWDEFVIAINKGNRALAPWCGRIACEETIKKLSLLPWSFAPEKETEPALAQKRSGMVVDESTKKDTTLSGSAKSLCIPFKYDDISPGTTCFACEEVASCRCLFGRSY